MPLDYSANTYLILKKELSLGVYELISTDREQPVTKHKSPVGGGRACVIPWNVVEPFTTNTHDDLNSTKVALMFENHTDDIGLCNYPVSPGYVHAKVPLNTLVPFLSAANIHMIAKAPKTNVNARLTKHESPFYFEQHDCIL